MDEMAEFVVVHTDFTNRKKVIMNDNKCFYRMKISKSVFFLLGTQTKDGVRSNNFKVE